MSKHDEELKDLLGDIDDAEQSTDQTVAQKGGRYLPPEGRTVARLVHYVEQGPQVHTFNGRESIHPTVWVGFELLGKNYINEETGMGPLIGRRLKLSQHPRATFFKIFQDMLYGRDGIRHMSRMLNEPFVLTIKHSDSSDGKAKYANIASVDKPYTMDENGDERLLKVPERNRSIQLLIWDFPSKAAWDSLFIDGEWEDDSGVKHSKNIVQQRILDGPEFRGSPLDILLSGIQDSGLTDAMLNKDLDDVPF